MLLPCWRLHRAVLATLYNTKLLLLVLMHAVLLCSSIALCCSQRCCCCATWSARFAWRPNPCCC
jgi:hypothetical protein